MITVVLVSPRNPLNIGAAARAMSNFGFFDLRLVNAYRVALDEARSGVNADAVLKEARELKDGIIAEAKTKAQKEGERMLNIAREAIQNEKMAAITELKNQVAALSVEIAEKILKEELSSQEKQKTLVKALLDDVNLN